MISSAGKAAYIHDSIIFTEIMLLPFPENILNKFGRRGDRKTLKNRYVVVKIKEEKLV